jgi:hypothetical protein
MGAFPFNSGREQKQNNIYNKIDPADRYAPADFVVGLKRLTIFLLKIP